ncbi:uncharacterized protein IWZ02DRAFT_206086 [Phyllosticta citriasiana]|uniref:uncharacterized protein n=1 Tax=Phyllosticta citriasiana TaxID=595635 RepID=UPI0030FD31A0
MCVGGMVLLLWPAGARKNTAMECNRARRRTPADHTNPLASTSSLPAFPKKETLLMWTTRAGFSFSSTESTRCF